MTTEYEDVLEAIEEILQRGGWPRELYISSETQSEWLEQEMFHVDQPVDNASVQTIYVTEGEREYLVGETDTGQEIEVEL